MSPTTQKLYSLLSARVIKVLALVAVALFGLLITGSVAFAGLPTKGVPVASPLITATVTPDPCAPVGIAVDAHPPLGSPNLFMSLAAASPSDVWAVGHYHNSADRTLIDHWDGTAWTVTPSPNVGSGNNQLFGVAAVSANNVWAVGRYFDGTSYDILAEHWDGTSWALVSLDPSVPFGGLWAASALSANDIWVVGYNGSSQSLVEHWNGTAWSVVPSPNVGTDWNVLQGVSALAPDNVWAVGFHSSNAYQTLVEHWDGTAWSIIPSPYLGPESNLLFGVSALSATDVWAAGTYRVNSVNYTVIEHWDGASWSVVQSPIPGSSAVLNAISARSANDIWAVGSIGTGSTSQTLVLHWDGVAWSQVQSPNGSSPNNELNAVAIAASGDIWAAGDSNVTLGGSSYGLTEHFTSPCITPSATATSTATLAPSATPTTDPCVITGTVVASPNGTGVKNELHAVSALAPNDVWAVGYSGDNTNDRTLAEHWDGTAWTIVSTPGQGSSLDRFTGVVAISSSDVWAVAILYIEHWDGTTWSIVPSPPPPGAAQFASIAASSSSDVWAVGNYYDRGASLTLIKHWNGTTWSIVASPNGTAGNNYLNGVSVVGPNDAWAVGTDGNGTLTEHWNGTAWSIVAGANPGATSNSFVAVSARATNDVWAIGQTRDVGMQYATLIEHWNGTAWLVVPSPSPSATNNVLLGVVAISANDVWAVGGQTSLTTDSLIEHWDGSSWTILDNPIGLPEYAFFAVDATSSGDVWAVGVYQPSTTILTLTEHFVLPCVTPTATAIVSATATPDPCAIIGIVVQSPNASGSANRLTSVVAISANDVWAAGLHRETVDQTLIEHWDGTSWSIVPSPNVGSADNDLNAIAAVSANNIWAVGYTGVGSTIQTLIEHWDGTAWSVSTLGSPISNGELAGISALGADDIWAVGYTHDTKDQLLTMHWDGATWSVVASPNAGAGDNIVTSVSIRASDDVWAVGFERSGSGTGVWQTLTEHWNGTAWSVVSSPNFGSSNNFLMGVMAISANDVWAVGGYSASNPVNGTLTEHWDGTSWTVVSSPNPSSANNIVTTVVASSANDVWAVGNTTGNNSEKSLVERWDGSMWSVVDSPNVGTSFNQLNGISLSPGGDAWVVGAYFADPLGLTLVEHFSAPCITPTAVPTNTPVPTSTSTRVPSATATPDPCGIVGSVVDAEPAVAHLESVSVLSANDVWAVGNYDTSGDYGTLVEHWNGSAWSIIDSPDPGAGNSQLFAVTAISANDVWAVGWNQNGGADAPLAEHWDGISWTVSNLNISVGNAQLFGIGAAAANDVWAVGGSALGTLVMHWDGTAWSLVPSPNVGTEPGRFIAISVQSANDIWAVGAYFSNSTYQTLTEHWDGTMWSVVQSPNENTRVNQLLGVSALSPTDVWAVGTYETDLYAQTLTEHWDGTSWTIVANPDLGISSDYLWAVDGTSSNNVWAVGLVQYASPASSRTLLLHWDGTSWSVAPSPNSDDSYNELLGVSVVSDGELWAVGGYAEPFSDTNVLTEHFTSPCITPTITPVGTSTSTSIPTQTAVGTGTQTATATPTSAGSPTASPTACTLTFEDVQPASWFYSYVQWMYCRGVISGYSTAPPCSVPGATCFKPQNNTTRGQVAKIVVLAFGFGLDTSGGPHFSDVQQGSTFYEYVETAWNKGLINGYADGTFRPNNNVTRAQVAKIAVLAAIDANPSGWTLLDPAVNTFQDVLPGSTFYQYVETAAAHSVLSGYPCGVAPAGACQPGNKPYFVPENNATRAQISKIVYLAVAPQQ